MFREAAISALSPQSLFGTEHTIKLIHELDAEIEEIENEIKSIMDEIHSPILYHSGYQLPHGCHDQQSF